MMQGPWISHRQPKTKLSEYLWDNKSKLLYVYNRRLKYTTLALDANVYLQWINFTNRLLLTPIPHIFNFNYKKFWHEALTRLSLTKTCSRVMKQVYETFISVKLLISWPVKRKRFYIEIVEKEPAQSQH